MKYYRKKYIRGGKRDKYSVEQSVFQTTVNASSQTANSVVPATTLQGMRKVKHLTVTLGSGTSNDEAIWALVYVPSGTTPSSLQLSQVPSASTALYEPNQYVMGCGIVDFSAGPCKFVCPVARNLNSGDQIYLLLANTTTTNPMIVTACVRYAVTLN